jgi:hypothetical protein
MYAGSNPGLGTKKLNKNGMCLYTLFLTGSWHWDRNSYLSGHTSVTDGVIFSCQQPPLDAQSRLLSWIRWVFNPQRPPTGVGVVAMGLPAPRGVRDMISLEEGALQGREQALAPIFLTL